MNDEQSLSKVRELATEVMRAFMIFPPDTYLEPLKSCLDGEHVHTKCITAAIEGLHSVITAANLPYQLVNGSTIQRRFDRVHSAESIRALKGKGPSPEINKDDEDAVFEIANKKMVEYLQSTEGVNFIRDQVVYEMSKLLNTPDIANAAQELLIQTLISSWSVFENYARSFVIEWLNENPFYAANLFRAPELKDFFGKQTIDIQTIDEHSFDLTRSMGNVIFNGRRLDNLGVIRKVMKVLFTSPRIQTALGKDLWELNQRRHLFVHNRGVVDAEYLKKTGDAGVLGSRLFITCDDLERHLMTIREAIVAIEETATKTRMEVLH